MAARKEHASSLCSSLSHASATKSTRMAGGEACAPAKGRLSGELSPREGEGFQRLGARNDGRARAGVLPLPFLTAIRFSRRRGGNTSDKPGKVEGEAGEGCVELTSRPLTGFHS